VSRANAGRRTVRDAMLRRPDVLGVDATVGEARAAFADDHVHLVLLVHEGGRLAGTVDRDDLAPGHPPGRLAVDMSATAARVVSPHAPLGPVHAQMARQGRRRLAVVDDDGRLVGLLCLKRSGTGFCSDRDVDARGHTARSAVLRPFRSSV
jgi:CBS domain-containing protein